MKQLIRSHLVDASIVAGIMAVVLLGATALMTSLSARAACNAPATTYGSDTVALSVPSAGSYTLWVRMQAPSSTSNQFMLQVNGDTCFTVGGSTAIPLGTWTWVNYQNGSSTQVMHVQLAAGANSLVLIGTQPKVVIDTVLALASSSCVPTDLGANCTSNQSTAPSGGSPTGSSTSAQAIANSLLPAVALSAGNKTLTPNGTTVSLSQPVTVSHAVIPGMTIKEAKYYLNNHLVFTATKSPYTYKLNPDHLLAGTYTLSTTTIYTTGEMVSASEKVIIAHSWYVNTGILLEDYWWLIIVSLAIVGFVVWWVVLRPRPVALATPPSASTPLIAPTQHEPTLIQPETSTRKGGPDV